MAILMPSVIAFSSVALSTEMAVVYCSLSGPNSSKMPRIPRMLNPPNASLDDACSSINVTSEVKSLKN